jgi:prevent-host-death family protein
MAEQSRYDLAQVRKHLTSIVTDAHAGTSCIITKHGKPYAAIVPIQNFENSRAAADTTIGLLTLRGTGRGFWSSAVIQTIPELRDEWGDVETAA